MSSPQLQETQLFALLDALPFGSFVFQLEDQAHAASLRILFANRASESMLGLDPSVVVGSLIGKHFPNSLGPSGPAEAYRKVVVEQEALDLGMVSYGDDRLPESRFAVSAYPVGSDLVVILFDNLSSGTERLTELAAIVDSAEDAILSKGLDGTIFTWNAAAELIYGYSAAEVIGQSISLLLPPDRPNEVTEILSRLRAGERIEQFQTTRLRKDGSVIDVSLTVSPITDGRGVVVGAATIARDIGAQKRDEAHVQRLAAIVDASTDGIFSRTLDGLVVSWNAGAEALLGYTADEMIGCAVDILVVDHERAAQIAESLSRGEAQKAIEIPLRRKDGSEVQVSAALSPVIDSARRVVGVAGVLRDLTERRRLEEQLRQSQKMEAIGNLAGGIAHDFNNLLLVIRGYSAVIFRRSELSEHDQSDLLKIDSAAERAAELTHQLLAFSRQQVLRPELVDLSVVADETLALLKRLLGENIRFEWALEPNLPLTMVDRGQFGQVVMNLAVNARDSMPDGGTITIRSGKIDFDDRYPSERADVAPGSYVFLQVTDSGIGMDQASQERVFDPFFTTKAEGTGLGLATVYGIVKQSGGHIWLYSELGIGTTFKLYFPVAVGTAEPVREQLPVGSLKGDETILLVEDDDLVRAFVVTALESYGYTVLGVASGAEALVIVEQRGASIDLLLTDLVMPGMNGRELAEQVRTRQPGLTVLFSSGYPSDVIARHDIAEARTNFIEKPYLPDDLARTVRALLDLGAQEL
jgi:two-component system cell cycle sensor histidine kinase/response regulator CckA